jgi:3-carboxy-cis,cis-muconate cycloisomerase
MRLPEHAAWAVHRGATSQDIIDTAAMLLAKRAIEVVLADLSVSAASCAAHATNHIRTVMSGRTLLQQAVPVTFGLVAAGWLTVIDEARQNLHRIKSARLAVQFGGAAGTLASLGDAGPHVAALLAEELGLSVPVLPWHTDRLRVVELAAALAGTCAALGKIARDVTLLAQTEVAEVHENAGGGRGGSSAMPHKQNPVAAITILGCTKQVPGLLATLAAATIIGTSVMGGAWHSEWQPLSHLLTLTGSAASWSSELLSALQIDPPRMRANLDATNTLPMAEHITQLLAPAMGRLQAHDLLAKATATATTTNTNLADALLADATSAAALAAAGITPSDLQSALRPESYLGATNEFIKRALAAHASTEEILRS